MFAMDVRFSPHNTHLEKVGSFHQTDPHLKQLHNLKLVYQHNLLNILPMKQPGIYSVTGGRQIGKTTLLKQYMARLLERGIIAENIAFFTGELIDDHHSLVRLFTDQLDTVSDGLCFFLLDEVSYIKDWDKAIKFMADSGQLANVVLVLTGSDTGFIKEARMRFPGRRGKADDHDFHLFPLSFAEFLQLKHRFSKSDLVRMTRINKREPDKHLNLLFLEFYNYLIHGGYLTAINDMAMENRILNSTLNTYSDWIRGDFLKRGKQEHYLRQIIQAIITRYGSQVTWNNLLTDLTIDHPKTVSDYVSLLETMDAAFIQNALVEDKLQPAPKKAKKLIFTDPFIFHALQNWIAPVKDPFEQVIKPMLSDSKSISKLVEACVVSHFRRYYETMYIKASGEVDIAYIHRKKFWPVEIKWTNQIRQKDLKQIMKYPNGRILAKTNQFGDLNNVPVIPLPIGILDMAFQSFS